LEKWIEDAPQARTIPDHAKWLYRSAMSLSKVTRNGVAVTLGSGAKKLTYRYDNPDLLVPRQGQKVLFTGMITTPMRMPLSFPPFARANSSALPSAFRISIVSTPPKSSSKAKPPAKKPQLQYSRTELRSIQPELQRNKIPIPTDATTHQISQEISAATAREEQKARVAKQTVAEIRKAALTPEELSDARRAPTPDVPEDLSQISAEDLTRLLNDP
jgi:hypothetical protein